MTLDECRKHYGKEIFNNQDFICTFQKDGYKILCQLISGKVARVTYSKKNKKALTGVDMEIFMKANAPESTWDASIKTSGGIITYSTDKKFVTVAEPDLSEFTIRKNKAKK